MKSILVTLTRMFPGVVLMIVLPGCFTMQERLVIVSNVGGPASQRTRVELSNALEIVNEVADRRGLKLDVGVNSTNLVALWIGETHSFLHNSKTYITVRQEAADHTLTISVSDNPPYSETRTARQINREIYHQLRKTFGDKRVARLTRTTRDPGWAD